MTRFFVGLSIVLVAVCAGVFGVRVLPNTSHPPHTARPAAVIGPLPLELHGAVYPGEVITQVVAYVQGVERYEQEQAAQAAERFRAARSTSGVSVVGGGTSSGRGACGDDWDCFRECTIDHESRSSGEYGAVSPGGTYRGAFQFLGSTWRSVSVNAGYGEWADVPTDQVPAWVQDAVAKFLWEHSGTQPWGGRCG